MIPLPGFTISFYRFIHDFTVWDAKASFYVSLTEVEKRKATVIMNWVELCISLQEAVFGSSAMDLK